MLEEPVVQERPQQQESAGTLGSAYADRRGLDVEDRAPAEKTIEKETIQLYELEDIARGEAEVADDGRRARKAGREHVSLSDALEGVSQDAELEHQLEEEASADLAEEETGFDESGRDQYGFDREGFDEYGFDENGLDKDGKPNPETVSQDEPEEKVEETKVERPLPKTIEDLLKDPEQAKAVAEHVTKLFERSQAPANSDPLLTDIFTDSLAKSLDTPAEALPQLKSAVAVLQYGAQSMIETQLPPMITSYFQDFVQNHLPQVLESLYPGMQASYAQASAANAWSDVCASEEFKGLSLPAFGTPEFQAAADELYAANPFLNTLDPLGPDGKQLPVAQALRAKAEICARLLAGARVDPKSELKRIAAAVETTKKGAESRNRRVSAPRSLGAGRTAGQLGETESYTSLRDAYTSNPERGGL
jgi:hypothetical protein